jgi:hypothetical protein
MAACAPVSFNLHHAFRHFMSNMMSSNPVPKKIHVLLPSAAAAIATGTVMMSLAPDLQQSSEHHQLAIDSLNI